MLGPIAAAFNGEARIIRDDAMQRGTILGAGWDRLSASRANAEIEYALTAERAGAWSRVDIAVRAILLGPLAQFGRSTIVNDLAGRLTDLFARNLERSLVGGPNAANVSSGPISAGGLLRAVIAARVRGALARFRDRLRR